MILLILMILLTNVTAIGMTYDCDNFPYGCPLCESSDALNALTSANTYTCAGVRGFNSPRVDENNVRYQNYSTNWDTIMRDLRIFDNSPCLTIDNTLAKIDKAGYCKPTEYNDNIHFGNKKGLVLNEFTGWNSTSFPLQGLHKIWGAGPASAPYNRGVNRKNIYISRDAENVNYVLGGSAHSVSKHVLVTEAHGNAYRSTTPDNPNGIVGGIMREGNKANKCPNWQESTEANDQKRVGAIAVTREQFGPGVYNVLAYVPKTTINATNGRGYVFAIWTFHYEEIYVGHIASPTQYRNASFPCYNTPDAVGGDRISCPRNGDVLNSEIEADPTNVDDLFSAVNHEIDFEFPCNSPTFDWEKDMTWNCMNVNTWLNDIQNYDKDSGAYYQQVSVTRNKSYISREPEHSVEKDYHWYTIDWHVNNTNPTGNYIAFYIDDPFDPTGTASVDGIQLPDAPTNAPIHVTKKFIPTRFGRLNIGPWMAWWGHNKTNTDDGMGADFDTAKVRTAFISITPNAGSGFDGFPQTFDQKDKTCDFLDLTNVSFVSTQIFNGCTDATAFNYNVTANTDDGSCVAVVNGCTDATAFNYNANANTDDGSCEAVVNGCTDTTAFNYDSAANTDDGSCEAVVNGCTEAAAFNYDFAANTDDGSCEAVVNGCTDATAFNYDSAANTNDGSCEAVVTGCTDTTAFNYDSAANTDDGSCVAVEEVVNGCTDATAFNYDSAANTNDGSCVAVVNGCTEAAAFNYNANANTDDGSCEAVVNGCTDTTALNYDSAANTDDGSCEADVAGCTDTTAFNYNANANTDDGSCEAVVNGCTDTTAFNYNATANTNDGSCEAAINGCTDTTAFNYDSAANTDDGSCEAVVNGCTDTTAFNYDSAANTDDGSCVAVSLGCTDATAFSGYNATANTDDGSCVAAINGCTDATAFNYNATANTNDGSCVAVSLGCTDATAFNYDSAANTNDGSCVAAINGCTDTTAFNYNATANTNDGSCVAVSLGCMDVTAFNYNATANTDDGSCVAVVNGCTEAAAFNYDSAANTNDGSCVAVSLGCTDVTAFNYNATANTDDGSCVADERGFLLSGYDPIGSRYNILNFGVILAIIGSIGVLLLFTYIIWGLHICTTSSKIRLETATKSELQPLTARLDF